MSSINRSHTKDKALKETIINIPRNLRAVGRTVVFIIASLFSTSNLASEYTPPGLYDVDYYQLPNGLHVLLKERHQAKSVSFRIVLNTGMADYPCGRKETPHFLEHLLFTGTSKHTESELDDLIEEHGGSWNASTGYEYTEYKLDIYSQYADLGLETLYEIMTDSQITQENVDKSRDIIHRESGGKPSVFKQWFYEKGIGTTGGYLAFDKLLDGTPYVCQGLEMADDIKRSDILDAYQKYYIPNNMTVIVVGDFDSAIIKNKIESTFGTMKSGAPYKRQKIHQEPIKEELIFTSTLAPILGSNALVGVGYVSVGTLSPDYYPMWFIQKYLSDRLYKKLRIDAGISYSPSIDITTYSDVEVMFAVADTELSTMDEVVEMIQGEIDLLVQQPVSDEEFLRIKNKLLLSIVLGYESNSGMAGYYSGSLFEFSKYGALVREEDKIKALTPVDIQRVATQYFGKVPRVVFYNTPTMTYKQLAVLLGIIFMVLVYFILRHFHRFREA